MRTAHSGQAGACEVRLNIIDSIVEHADAFSGIMGDMLDSRTNSDVGYSDAGGSRSHGSLSGESSIESLAHECQRGSITRASPPPGALVRRLSSAGCRSPELRAGACSSITGKNRVTGVCGDENSPLLSNKGAGTGLEGKRRGVSVPRLILGDPNSI